MYNQYIFNRFFECGVKSMNKKIDDNYISLEDAALYLNIKSGTLRKWIKKKPDMPAHQIGKLWKFKRVELDEWINSGKSAMSDDQKCDK